MEIKRINEIDENNINDNNIYELVISFENPIYNNDTYIEIKYNNYYGLGETPILDRIKTQYLTVIFHSKRKENLKEQEQKMIKILRENIIDNINSIKSQIIKHQQDITNMTDAYNTLSFREQKLKRILEK